MKNILITICSLFVLSSCEKVFFEDELSASDPFLQFDYLWEQVDRRYSFFDVKGIDWDQKREEYRAQISRDMTDEELFEVLGGMMTELRDDHTNLSSTFNVSFFGFRYDKPDNYESRVVIDHYIGSDFFISGPFQHDFIDPALAPQVGTSSIGYIRFSAFTGTVDDVNLDFMLNKYENTNGLIVDLRENGGGAVTDVFNILERFIDGETVVYKSRIRNGAGRDDFSDLEEAIADPHKGLRYTSKPVVFLVDRGTYSAGSFTSLSTKAIPNITLMGDSTGGGLGLPNGGQLPNGWDYRFSVTQAMTVDQADRLEAGLVDEVNAENFENGVPPDVYVTFDWTNLNNDEILDAAIASIIADPRN